MAGRRQFDEQQTLERALEVFWTKGYGATSMQDLAAATGVQRGSLYNAYHDKESLFLRAYEGHSQQLMADVAEQLAHPDVEQALLRFFNFTIASMLKGSPSRGCLTTKAAMGTDDEDITAVLRSSLDTMERLLLERLCTEGARARLTVPPAEAARVLVTMTRGVVVMARLHPDQEQLTATAASLVRSLLAAPVG
ncbi:TetR/AcrR family transcriptional regulator [Streptomyces sp. NPDC008222]|uniref:TetR/AcrR family transcriptional regulator n=1 Tax=Streptomyces sp. NPDC008222 TaxID=3364820 RepID=UPI0036E2FC83